MSETNAADIGTNITRAARVMRETHREVSGLLAWFDEALGARGWAHVHVTSSNWVGLAQNGAKIGEPENWMATVVQRAYMRDGGVDDVRDGVIVVEIDLAPEGASVPVAAVLALRLVESLSPRQFWSAWSWQAGGAWRHGCTDGLVDPDAAALARLVRGASPYGRGLVVPLCELDRRSIEARVLDPALDLLSLLTVPHHPPTGE